MTGSGLATLTSARSARATTAVVAVALLFVVSGSVVVVVVEAVFERLVPSGVLALTVALMTMTASPAAASVPTLAEPVHDADGPPLRVYVAPVSWLGRGSLTLTPWASDGPPLWTVIV